MRRALALVIGLLILVGAAVHAAAPAPFDLTGPTLRVAVTHGGQTPPIAQVPHFAASDRIAVRADLPESQSAHYLPIAALPRGTTNPPPGKCLLRAGTRTRKGRRGLTLTVPEGARQIALPLAPATGGDFSTLRDAGSGRPSAFFRAAQELMQASLDPQDRERRSDRFLVAAVGARSDLADAVAVPEGFLGRTIAVPRPIDGELFLRLHDDPATPARLAG